MGKEAVQPKPSLQAKGSVGVVDTWARPRPDPSTFEHTGKINTCCFLQAIVRADQS